MASQTDQKPLTKKSTPTVVVTTEPKKRGCCGYHYIKALVILYAILYLLVGLILLAAGAWVLSVKADFDNITDVVTSPAVVALVVGIIIIITAVLGIIGAAKEKHILLKIFFVIIILVFLLQIMVGILAFIYRNETINNVSDNMNLAIKEYHTNSRLHSGVNTIQRKFGCCGTYRARDWETNPEYTCATLVGERYDGVHCGVPDSCCREVTDGCGSGVRRSSKVSEVIYMNGCSTLLKVWLASNLDMVGGMGLGFALLHVLGIFAVYWFLTKIEDRRKLFKYRSRHYEG